jgi:hypothetical protein
MSFIGCVMPFASKAEATSLGSKSERNDNPRAALQRFACFSDLSGI